MKNYLKIIATSFIVVAAFVSTQAQTLHWNGGSGNWTDAKNWSIANGTNQKIALPDRATTVVFDSKEKIQISLPEKLFSRDVIITSGTEVRFISDFNTHWVITGNLDQEGKALFEFFGDFEFSGKNQEINFGDSPSIFANINFTGDNPTLTGSIKQDFSAGMSVCADLNFNSQQVQTGFLSICDSAKRIDLRESIIYVDDELDVPAALEVIQNGSHVFVNPESQSKFAPGNINLISLAADPVDCGTGSGQTPFTIDAQIVSDYNGQDISCNNAEDGQAFVDVSGGVGPFSFMWIGGPSTQQYNGLGAGTYTVIVVDLGQNVSCGANVQLTEPSEVNIFGLNLIPPTCADSCTGEASPTPFGGTGSYSFLWNSTETTQNISTLCQGDNNLQISDINGCVFDTTFTVPVDGIEFGLTVNDALCFGGSDGSATSSPSGGAGGPYVINWSTGDSGTSTSGLSAGNYTLTVEDVEGCQVDTLFEVGEGPQIVITTDSLSDLTCFESNDGEIYTTISGGISPYDPQWSGPGGFTSSNEDLSGLEAGTYFLEVTDDNSCQETTSVTISQPTEIVLTSSETMVDCFGASTGQIDLEISGGTIPYIVDWTGPDGFTANTEDISGLEAGFYNAIVTDDNGCTESITVQITEPNEIQLMESISPITCFGEDDGAIDLTPTGGTSPYSFTWVGPSGFSSNDEDISNLAPGDYDVTLTDDNSCISTATFTIDPVADITIDLTETPITCNGSDDGEISAVISGGTPGYTISWTGPNGFSSSDADISGLEPGTYNILVTDAASCEKTDQIVLSEPLPITVSESITDVTCNGFSDGSIDITPFGGTPGYNFDWTGPDGFTSTDEDISMLEAGNYEVTVTDSQNCEYIESFTVNEFPPIVIDADFESTICAGENAGAIDLTVSGGVSPYDFSWNGPSGFTSTSEDISSLEAGTYTVIVQDQANCADTADYVIDSTTPILIEATFSDPVCNGDANGEIDLTISGGDTPYDILWNTSATTEDLTGLAAGTYSVEVTDANNCTETEILLTETGSTVQTITLNDPPLLELSADVNDIDCFGDTTGTIDLTITGGVPSYSISWTGPDGFTSVDEDLADLQAGDYEATVIDNAGCIETILVSVSEPTEITADAILSTQLCGEDLGSIDLEISGGTMPYTTSWTGPDGFASFDEDIANLEQGMYNVTITDDNGCSIEEGYEITGPSTLEVIAITTDLDCSGNDNGVIEIEISGGTTPITIDWFGPDGFSSNDEDIFNLAAGSYLLEIEDDNGCTLDSTFNLTQPTPISLDAVISDPLCAGDENGSIELETSGGTPPLIFNWTGPDGFASTDEDIFDLATGTYDLQITDQGDCALDTFFTVNPTDPLSLDLDVVDVSCIGLNNGSVDLTISGGNPPYTTGWTGPDGFISADEDIANLEPGSYEVTVLDDNNCETTATVEVLEGADISFDTQTTPSSCDTDDGSAMVENISGGSEPYDISWEDALGNEISTSATADNIGAGEYTVTVSDQNSCEVSATVTVENTASADLSADVSNALCNGDNSGAIDLTITSGTPPFDIEWNGPDGFFSTDEDISNLEVGDYTVTVVDDAGCLSSEVFTVDEPGEIFVDATLSDILCNGDSTGSIDITVSGGTPGYDYNWSGPGGFGSTEQNIDSLLAGTYTLEVTDTNSCIGDTSFTLSEADPFDLSFILTDTICNGATDGQINVTVSGATSPYDFNWTAAGGYTSPDEDISDLASGDYTLTVTDDNGCTIDSTVTIYEADELLVTVDEVLPDCQQANGSLTANPTGGAEGTSYSYFWYDVQAGNTLISQTQTIDNIPAGIYYLEVFDDLGCSVSETIPLSDDAGTLAFDITDVECYGEPQGEIDMTISDATDPVVIDWTGPDAFTSSDEDLTGLFAGEYTVQVTDDLGCELYDIVEIIEPDSISIDFETTDITCAGLANGTIVTTVTGGADPYSFLWTGPNGFSSSDQDLSDLEAGCYTLEVTDDNNCVKSAEVCISSVPTLDITATITNIECAGDSTGAIVLEVNGGTPDYTFDWTGPDGFASDQQNIDNLLAGDYNLQLSDANGCGLDSTFTLFENPPFDISAMVTSPSCPGADDGEIDLTLSGGAGGLSTSWTGPDGFTSVMEDLTGLSSGDYELTLTDSIGCSVTNLIPVNDPDSLNIDIDAQNVTCNGDNDGSIFLTISGGTPPYSSAWSGPGGFTSTESELEDLEPGVYGVVVTDDNGCTISETVEISEASEIDLSVGNLQNESCPDAMDGLIDINISGGLPNYDFNWTGPNGFTADSEDISELSAGNYSVSISDSAGCELSIDDINLTVMDSVTVSTTGNIAECFGTGPYMVIGSNIGSGVDSQFWTNSDGDTLSSNETLDIDPEAGNYTFIYTAQAGGCSASDTVTVDIFELPVADAGEDEFVFVEEEVTLGGDPATGENNSVDWFPGENLSDSAAFNPTTVILETTTFILTATSPEGCTAQDTVVISIVPEIEIPSGFSPNGDGINELWLIENIGQYPNTVVEVYNRWGDLLYRSAGSYEPWDGKYEGNVVPVGTYYYVIDINEPEFKDEITGPLTILR